MCGFLCELLSHSIILWFIFIFPINSTYLLINSWATFHRIKALQFVYSFTSYGHLGCVQFLTIMIKFTITAHSRVLVWTCIFISFPQISRSKIGGSQLCLLCMFCFYQTAGLLSKVTAWSCTPTGDAWEFQLLCILISHSDRCAVGSHCCNLYFPNE